MAAPRRDTRGIVDAPGLFTRVQFRRRTPAAPLRPYVEHYWLIDWDLSEPYATHVVPHPCVNLVFQRYADRPGFGEVAGVGLELFAQKLTGRGRVCGVQFRPGGFRPFTPERPATDWTDRRLPLATVFGASGTAAADTAAPDTAAPVAAAAVLEPDDEDARVAALDAFLIPRVRAGPRILAQTDLAMGLADRIRTDRTIRRVADFAQAEGMSVRALQRLFAGYVGVSPKWVLLRYRVHEALERAASDAEVDWAALAAELGYSDQAHLIRDISATVGVSPTAYAR
ncbi:MULTISPECIES: helix-turn-helix domain-containing protein [unclassified Streptomyces]|uniref:AraC family transcriptional regulator n=1 Tax=unclassified Streptomyces TaxID=2593676 RepID=UPI00088522E0|nr:MULTISPECIES: helix-turn-helix domain-containing protein [unclassified Streptomyces]PBC83273.1 helix-turn-helix protein [Streptomyces sp. 2321.6]SDR43772.1 Helix-turn-helix domain-containing protein [Streptomyces sp. KS_16]SEC90686.1 Helix-turn-helix domain-containing protein [Streptomyces sp. 2133.1]SNC69351.1 Helix-turn-helix domain-containing protein [Streptomyces sp. 2114.4]